MTEPTSKQEHPPDDDARFEELLERSSLGTAGARQLRRRIPPAEAEFIGKLADTLEVLGRPSTHTTESDHPEYADTEGGDLTDTAADYSRPWSERPEAINFWDALTPTERDSLRSVADAQTFDAGATLTHEGESVDHVRVILSGRVQIHAADNGKERIIAQRGPGDLVGERSVLVSARSATVTALERVSVLAIRTRDFAGFIAAHPQVLEILESHVYDRPTQMPTTTGSGRSPRLNGQNCTIVLTDVVGFGSRIRNDEDRRVIRQVLYGMMQMALPSPPVWLEDRGSGLLSAIPPAVPTANVIEQLLEELPAALELYNSNVRESGRFQLRIAVNVGPVFSDPHGVRGEAIIDAARLVEAPAFKKAITRGSASLGLIVSPFVYEYVVRHTSDQAVLRAWSQVRVEVKETDTVAWIQTLTDQIRGSGSSGGTYEMPPDDVEESAVRWAQPRPSPGPQSSGEPYPAGPVSAEVIGYRRQAACAAAGITYNQLDYWARTGLVEPSVRAAHGSGTQRLYSLRDILVLKVVKRLLDTGISLQQIRAAVQHLRDHGSDDLAQVTLMSDGVSVYECTSPDDIADLLQGGHGVFGIALDRVRLEVEDDLAVLPAVQAEDDFIAVDTETTAPAGEEESPRIA